MDPLADTAEFNFATEFERLFAKHFGPASPRAEFTFGASVRHGQGPHE